MSVHTVSKKDKWRRMERKEFTGRKGLQEERKLGTFNHSTFIEMCVNPCTVRNCWLSLIFKILFII